MKRTALILAGAVAFDLGVMVVAVDAQQQTQTPQVRIPTTSTGPTFPGPGGGAAMGQASAGTRPGDCVLRPGQPVPGGTGGPCGPAAISDQAAAGNLTSFAPTAQSGGETRGEASDAFCYSSGRAAARDPRSPGGPAAISDHIKIDDLGGFKIDRVNTVEACTARRGEVVMHEGAQQCRLPDPASPGVGNPLRNRPIPPR